MFFVPMSTVTSVNNDTEGEKTIVIGKVEKKRNWSDPIQILSYTSPVNYQLIYQVRPFIYRPAGHEEVVCTDLLVY